MKYFKVLAGTHTDSKGKTYNKGDIVKTDLDLDKMFQNKFEVVNAMEAKAVSNNKAPNAMGNLVEHGGDPTSEKPIGEMEKPEGDEDSTGDPEVEDEVGDDVSHEFLDAEDAGLKVFKTDDGYTVYDAEKLDDPLNSFPMKGKKEVHKFIAKNKAR